MNGMSVGVGILLSTILLITVWQIDKRNAWRIAAKISLWVLAVITVVGAAIIGGGVWWETRSHRQEVAAELAKFRDPHGLTYWGLSMDMSKAEVRYLKGEPTETPVPSRAGAPEQWTYRLGVTPNTIDYDIYWDKAGEHPVAIICQGPSGSACDTLAGLGKGSSESYVRETLGKPDGDNPPNDKGLKILEYGTGKEKLLFFLSRGQVDSMALTRKDDEDK